MIYIMNDKKKEETLKTGQTTPKKGDRILYHSEYDDPGIYDEFYPHWGPGSKYKPWIA